jgi:hypothetical protein
LFPQQFDKEFIRKHIYTLTHTPKVVGEGWGRGEERERERFMEFNLEDVQAEHQYRSPQLQSSIDHQVQFSELLSQTHVLLPNQMSNKV